MLAPFNHLTDILSGEESATVSSVVPLITHIRELCAHKESDSELASDMKRTIIAYIEERLVGWMDR